MDHKKTPENSSILSKLSAVVLISVNLIVMFCSILVMGISLWSMASPSSLTYALQLLGGNTTGALIPDTSVQSAAGVVVVSIMVIIIASMGCYGAVSRSQFALFMYATLVILLLLLECALFYHFTSNILEKGVQTGDGQWAHYTRLAFKCCDFSNTGYQELTPPWSCCGTVFFPDNCTVQHFYQHDCHKAITSWIRRYDTAIYVSLAVLHFILLSCSLLRRSRSVSSSHS